MKPKLILCLTLVLSVGLFGCATKSDSIAQLLPDRLPPIANANPSIRCPISIHVPTKLKIERTTRTLALEIDTNSFEATNITVGTNMIIGVWSTCWVHLADDPFWAALGRPMGQLSDRMGWGLCAGTDFNLGKISWNKKGDGVPLSGKKYVVEAVLTVFETDIPPQLTWSPWRGKYKVLWRQTLKQTVE